MAKRLKQQLWLPYLTPNRTIASSASNESAGLRFSEDGDALRIGNSVTWQVLTGPKSLPAVPAGVIVY